MGRRAIKLIKPKRKYTRRVPKLPEELPISTKKERPEPVSFRNLPASEQFVSEWDVLRAAAMKAEKDEFTFAGKTYRTLSGRAVAPAATHVLVSLPLAEAEEIAFGMADLLCWHRGYGAGRKFDGSTDPMGVEQVRTMRIALDGAIRQAREKGEK